MICALGNLHYQISREKFEPEPGFERRTSRSLAWRSTTGEPGRRTRITEVVEHQARDLEARGSNPGSGSKFSLEI